jgi:hypothetical protein
MMKKVRSQEGENVAKKQTATATPKKTPLVKKTIVTKVGNTNTKPKTVKINTTNVVKKAVKKSKKITPTKSNVIGSKSSTNKTKQSSSKSVVVLPTRMSIRAREKVLVYAEAIEKRLHRPAYALTMTLGMLFILFGSFTGFFYSSLYSDCSDNCAAQVLVPLTQSLQPLEVSLLTQLPPVVDGVERITINTKNVKGIEVYAKLRTDTDQYVRVDLSTKELPGNRYKFTIDSSELDPGLYVVHVTTYNSLQDELLVTLGEFTVAEVQSLSSLELTQADVAVTQESSNLINPPVSEEGVGVDQVVKLNEDETMVDSTQETANVLDIPNEKLVDTININGKSTLSGVATFTVLSSTPKSLSIYLRRAQSTERQLAGRFSSSDKRFTLNTRNFPNGSYELFLEASNAADDTVSNSKSVTISNVIDQIIETKPTSEPVQNEDREVLKITKELISPAPKSTEPTHTPAIPAPVKPIPPVLTSAGQSEIAAPAASAPTRTEEPSESNDTGTPEDEIGELNDKELDFNLQEPIKRRALVKLEADTEKLDELFTRYAVAVQSGDIDLIREARRLLTTYKQTLVEVALSDETDRFIADDLSVSLEEEIERIIAKVETFESLRRQRLDSSANKDTDGDGITDTDERVLFKTDPLKADTDGDGFTDGVEIIKGFNPNDAASEAVIVYRSPKETIGIVANENLKVHEVTPDIQPVDPEQETPIVRAKVRGEGLPNSFVTLYIFSTPTVVTVRTEADGSFEYTFSKELEDGEHQVFVTLTDNTGDIVAQSAPFTFIKQAEAFSVVDARAVVSDIQAADMLGTPASPYRTVLSMSVLALGILLILLGVGLRSNKPDETDILAST